MKKISLFFLFLATASGLSGATPEPLKPASASASSTKAGYDASKAIDGTVSDDSRWVSEKGDGNEWIELKLPAPTKLIGLHLHSGYQGGNPLRDFVVQYWKAGKWVDIPSANVTGNKSAALTLRFDDTVDVTTDRLRIEISGTADGVARVSEIVVWPAAAGSVPPISKDESTPTLVFLNQAGFNSGKPKRFTAPTLKDGIEFQILPAAGGAPVFTGRIEGNVGDLTAFEPKNGGEYVVVAGGLTSVPFRVEPWLIERITYQGAVDFMVDSRHYVGNDRRKCVGSYGWRDDHHFGWQLHTLVPQWLSNPAAYERMPRQVTYEAPTDPALWGKLEPPLENAPDIVKLIHWGADVIVTQNTTHELMKSQLAYFLYAWPWLKDYLPAQNYEVVRDFAFEQWANPVADHKYPYDESAEHDLLAVKTKIGNTKGAYPPGFSIQPNLLMYEVANREKRPDAQKYLDAAVAQADWIVQNLDWNDPQTTKGQRMSEFITMTGLAHLLRDYPDRAPAGLAKKINEWADVVIRRSDNLWDFRKLGDAPDQWTPMGDKPTMWNEPGNVVGLPAAILAAKPFITDPKKQARLNEIAWAHFDSLFGRNPTGRHFSYDAPREIAGVEHGWYNFHVGGIGRLEHARFVIDGSPKNQHFPFHPEVGNVGWTEGWIQHNTPFNLSLAYLAQADTKIELKREGDDLVVRLTGPLNFEPEKAETATVTLKTKGGDEKTIVVTEESPNAGVLTGRIRISPTGGDKALKAAAGSTVEASYGFGYLANTATLQL
jgi:hypothetical protein